MEKKICTKCNLAKAVDQFRVKRNQCKECECNRSKAYNTNNSNVIKINKSIYNDKNKDEINLTRKKYREKNIDKIKVGNKTWREDNKEHRKVYQKEYKEANKDKIKQQRKVYREANKDKIKNYQDTHKDHYKKYCKDNKTKISSSFKKWSNDNKDKVNKQKRIYTTNRKAVDPLFKLSASFRTNLSKIFKRYKYTKSSKTAQILGCSFEDFKLYLESKFEPWMNWDNKGLYNGELNHGWDIDHNVPLSSAKTECELISLLHYNNCQPLCSKVNRDIKKDIISF